MIRLGDLNEAGVVHNLLIRYQQHKIYVSLLVRCPREAERSGAWHYSPYRHSVRWFSCSGFLIL